jgi:hypothetical protein
MNHSSAFASFISLTLETVMHARTRFKLRLIVLSLALASVNSQAGLLSSLGQSLKLPLLGGAANTAPTSTSAASANAAAIATQALALRNAISTGLPTLAPQAAASPMAIYQLFHTSLINPLNLLQQFPLLGGATPMQQFMNAFPDPQGFADWLALLQTSPDVAIAQYQSNPAATAKTLTDLTNVTKMLSDRLPANMANNLSTVGQLMAGLMGGGVAGGGPLAIGPDSHLSHTTMGNNGLEQMWCNITNDGGLIGRILRGTLGQPVQPSPGGAGYGASLLPKLGIGSSPTGTGFSQTIDYTPLLNSNTLTEPLNQVVTRILPVLPRVLPNSILGLLTFRTYYTTDRTGAGADAINVPANSPDWRAAAIDVSIPGLMRLWTVEFICPGMNRHSINATPPVGTNPYYDPTAESNYTGYTNFDLKHRKLTLSWGFGDGLIDDVWIYGHYAPFTLFGQGDTGPGVMKPGTDMSGGTSSGGDSMSGMNMN